VASTEESYQYLFGETINYEASDPRTLLDGHERLRLALEFLRSKSDGAAAPARNEEIDIGTMVLAAQLRPNRAGHLRAGTGANSATQKRLRHV
jgi:hypothetical protein